MSDFYRICNMHVHSALDDFYDITFLCLYYLLLFEPRCEKTGLRGFRHNPGGTIIEDG